MGADAFALCEYWRQCLADIDLRSPNLKGAVSLKLEEVTGGSIPAETAAAIFLQAGRKEDDERATVSLLIAPFGLRRWFHHGTPKDSDTRVYYPLWIPARLDREGGLEGTQFSPWISREFLAPVYRDVPVAGRLEDLEEFLTREILDDLEWAKVLDYSERMLEAVTGQRLASLRFDDFENLPPVAVPWSEDKGISSAIRILYEKICELASPPPLLRTLAAGARPGKAPEPYDLQDPGPALQHCGQMSGAFPLSPSQRQALHGLLTLEEGSLLAVNGPPGTGKTTFLQSVVASLWVKAALDQREPPIIVACSTNNQAVTNIMDSFAATASSGGDSPFAERWLPDLTSYGLYLPSQGKLGTSKYQAAVPGKPEWQGLPEEMENSRYLTRAQVFFLEKARQVLTETETRTVADAVRGLHQRMAQLQARIKGCIDGARDAGSLRRAHGVFGYEAANQLIRDEEARKSSALREQEELHAEVLAALESVPFWEDLFAFLPPIRKRRNRRLALPFLRRHLDPPSCSAADFIRLVPGSPGATLKAMRAELEKIQLWKAAEDRLAENLKELGSGPLDDPGRILDRLDLLRHRLFLLAGRYWEGRWLLEMEKLIGSGQKLSAQIRKACEARFRRFSMLTPCMVSTFHQAAKVFIYFDPESREEFPLFSTLDLLIVDEAGQTSPDIGSAAFSLAKKALVVGDVHQIEPVWSIPPRVDFANLQACGITPPEDGNGEDAAAFRACRGSVMMQARGATSLTCEGERGLLLTEHRRCVPEVIRYCNELIYGGRLQPLRPSKTDRVLPALGWAHITAAATSDGGSRINPGEALAIAGWLGRHRRQLEEHYQRPIGEIVGVITPFVAQRGILEKNFRSHGLTGVQAGTVHTFQGAERPVVLFSPVYSLSNAPRTLFFDVSPSLLNVAVSRAKDSFLVFGDLRLFDSGKVHLPSGKLAALLFEAPENEITDVESAQHLKDKPGARRIATLEEHRATLRRALESAIKQVLIVSPYLSINAVEADEVAAAVTRARTRGVHVCIVYSRDLSSSERNRRKAIEALEQAGAEVRASKRMHNKTLAVDERWMVEGSFNWLSASRDKEAPVQRHEASFLCEGPHIRESIRTAWREIQEIRH